MSESTLTTIYENKQIIHEQMILQMPAESIIAIDQRALFSDSFDTSSV